MKTVEQLAREAGFPERRAFSDLSDLYPRLERFHDAAIAQYREGLLAGVGEAVAFLVEGTHNGKLISHALYFTVNEAKNTASVFAQHYPTVNTIPLYTADQLAAAVAIERERCAKVVEEFPHDQLGCLDEVVAAIRGQ